MCANPANALGKAMLADQITNGASFVGRRPVIFDRRFVIGEALILQIYCPEELAGLPGEDRRAEVRRHDQALMAAGAPDRPAGKGVLAAACVSALVVNANTSAVTILLPSISEDVGAPVAELQWAVTGYSLVGAAVIVTSGALGDVLGRRKVFLAGLALFIASCVLIALSTTGAGVVGGRMIQGASGATILACGMSLLSVSASGAGADEGDHALGRGVRRRAARWARWSAACWSTRPAGRGCSGSTPRSPPRASR